MHIFCICNQSNNIIHKIKTQCLFLRTNYKLQLLWYPNEKTRYHTTITLELCRVNNMVYHFGMEIYPSNCQNKIQLGTGITYISPKSNHCISKRMDFHSTQISTIDKDVTIPTNHPDSSKRTIIGSAKKTSAIGWTF